MLLGAWIVVVPRRAEAAAVAAQIRSPAQAGERDLRSARIGIDGAGDHRDAAGQGGQNDRGDDPSPPHVRMITLTGPEAPRAARSFSSSNRLPATAPATRTH